MCEKCAEIDKRIEHYERIVASINNQLTINRFKELVANFEAEKAALHPEQKYDRLSWNRPLPSLGRPPMRPASRRCQFAGRSAPARGRVLAPRSGRLTAPGRQ